MIDVALMSLSLLSASQDAPAGDIAIRVSGSGRWRVECTFETEQGQSRTRQARGRGLNDFDTLRGPDSTAAHCTYEASEGARALIRFQFAEGFSCPFDPALEIEDCQLTLVGPQQGEFTLDRP